MGRPETSSEHGWGAAAGGCQSRTQFTPTRIVGFRTPKQTPCSPLLPGTCWQLGRPPGVWQSRASPVSHQRPPQTPGAKAQHPGSCRAAFGHQPAGGGGRRRCPHVGGGFVLTGFGFFLNKSLTLEEKNPASKRQMGAGGSTGEAGGGGLGASWRGLGYHGGGGDWPSYRHYSPPHTPAVQGGPSLTDPNSPSPQGLPHCPALVQMSLLPRPGASETWVH